MIIEIWVKFIVMETLMSFSDRLAYALKAKGARAVDLANALDISRPAVSLLLSGKNKGMRPEHLVRAAEWLDVRIEWLATGEGNMQPRRLSVQQRALLALTDEMHPETIDAMLKLLAQVSSVALPRPSVPSR